MPRESDIVNRWLREPLVHFLLLASLLFLLEAAFSGARKEIILVEQQTIDYLIQQREELELRQLSPEERRETIATFVEEEILYREAYRRGLDRGDSRMRRNLILKMRGLLVGEVEPPTEQELRAFFEQNRGRFSSPATWSLEQVYFSDPGKVPHGLLDALRAGLDPTTVGEDSLFTGTSLPRRTQREIAGTFGPQAARAILDIDDDRWHGPFESPRGVHFVRVVGRQPAQEASYASLDSYLEDAWMMDRARRVVEQEIDWLREDYDILIEDAGETTQ